jgi:hypothetical protein
MNKKNSFSPLIAFMAVAILCGGGWKMLDVFSVFDQMSIFQKHTRCDSHLPSEDLRTTDLIGTWVAGFSDETDTLILREDNKYKQIIHSERRNINYQTEWQEWQLEREESGFVYLHLKGMRMCGLDSLRSCEDVDYNGYDFCSGRSVVMKGEGILLVLYQQEDGPFAGLRLFFPLGSENVWVYEFQKP